MTIVFLSNYYNHHQSAFSETMYKLTDGNFYFIATEPMAEERKNMGWNVEKFPVFVKFQYLDDKSRSECQNLIDNSDVVIIGSAPNKLIKYRLSQGRLTFRYSERPYKKDVEWYRLIVHTIRAWKNSGRYKNLFMLCASAYTSSDLRKIHSFRNKCYKWGYFPPVKVYDNINVLIQNKKPASILWVARLIELKHPEVPIQVMKKLIDCGYNAQLSIIGDGPLREHLNNMIQDLNLQANVHLLGSMKPDEVREHMEQSQIFLFTSDKNEGWGAVLNESMNSACAVISSHAIGSTPFLINDGINGLIYKDGDIEDIFNKVKSLLDNEDSRIKMAKNAYNSICTEWNAEFATKRLITLIEALQQGKETPFKSGPCSKAHELYDTWK